MINFATKRSLGFSAIRSTLGCGAAINYDENSLYLVVTMNIADINLLAAGYNILFFTPLT